MLAGIGSAVWPRRPAVPEAPGVIVPAHADSSSSVKAYLGQATDTASLYQKGLSVCHRGICDQADFLRACTTRTLVGVAAAVGLAAAAHGFGVSSWLVAPAVAYLAANQLRGASARQHIRFLERSASTIESLLDGARANPRPLTAREHQDFFRQYLFIPCPGGPG